MEELCHSLVEVLVHHWVQVFGHNSVPQEFCDSDVTVVLLFKELCHSNVICIQKLSDCSIKVLRHFVFQKDWRQLIQKLGHCDIVVLHELGHRGVALEELGHSDIVVLHELGHSDIIVLHELGHSGVALEELGHSDIIVLHELGHSGVALEELGNSFVSEEFSNCGIISLHEL